MTHPTILHTERYGMPEAVEHEPLPVLYQKPTPPFSWHKALDWTAFHCSRFSVYHKARLCDFCEAHIDEDGFARGHDEDCPIAVLWMVLRTEATR